MKKQFSLLIFFFLAACGGHSPGDDKNKAAESTSDKEAEYVWTKIADSAQWRKSYNFQMFTIGDTLWVFHPDGNWFSSDGINWAKSPLPDAINNLAFLDYVPFKNTVLGLGHFEGNIERHVFKNETYKTVDFIKWDTLKAGNNLPVRFFYHPFIFDNKIWIAGGEDDKTLYADIWNSPDGVVWTKQKDSLPFGRRSNSQFVFFNGKIFLLNNDVWSSVNGLDWELVTPEIVPGEEIFGYAPVVFDNKIWLTGCNRNEQFTSQVLVSSDGKTWEMQHAPWAPRGGVAATVFKNKIYITGGKYGGTPDHPDFRYDNDIWVLEKKER